MRIGGSGLLTVLVLKGLEDEEVLFQSKKKRKALREAAAQEATHYSKSNDGNEAIARSFSAVQVEHVNGVKFY